MRLDNVWREFAYVVHQLWAWLSNVTNDHPFLALGMGAVVIVAWGLYKMDIRAR